MPSHTRSQTRDRHALPARTESQDAFRVEELPPGLAHVCTAHCRTHSFSARLFSYKRAASCILERQQLPGERGAATQAVPGLCQGMQCRALRQRPQTGMFPRPASAEDVAHVHRHLLNWLLGEFLHLPQSRRRETGMHACQLGGTAMHSAAADCTCKPFLSGTGGRTTCPPAGQRSAPPDWAHGAAPPTCRNSSSWPATAKFTAMRCPPALLRLPSTPVMRRKNTSCSAGQPARARRSRSHRGAPRQHTARSPPTAYRARQHACVTQACGAGPNSGRGAGLARSPCAWAGRS